MGIARAHSQIVSGINMSPHVPIVCIRELTKHILLRMQAMVTILQLTT